MKTLLHNAVKLETISCGILDCWSSLMKDYSVFPFVFANMSHRFVARSAWSAGCGGRPDAHARGFPEVPWAPGTARPRSLSGGLSRGRGYFCRDQTHASDVPPWMCGESKRRRLGTGAGSSCDHLFAQGAGHQGFFVAPRLPDPVAGRSRYSASRSDSFPPLDAVAGGSRLSLQVSKAISCFARYPHRRPAGLTVTEDGSLSSLNASILIAAKVPTPKKKGHTAYQTALASTFAR